MSKIEQNILLILVILSLFTGIAYAYLDPGTGSYIMQIFLALIIGVLYTLKLYWAKTKAFLKNIFFKKGKEL
jgi:hypothetical protein